jgi:nitrite reductase/ring-hydroxylating ferredoxin subunit
MKSPGYAFVKSLKRAYEGAERDNVEYIHGRHFLLRGGECLLPSFKRTDIRARYSTYMLPSTERSRADGVVMKTPVSPKRPYFISAMETHVAAVDALCSHKVNDDNMGLVHDMLVTIETLERGEKFTWLDDLLFPAPSGNTLGIPHRVSVDMRMYAYCRGICVEALTEELLRRGMRIVCGHRIKFPHGA